MTLLANVGVPRETMLPYRDRPEEETPATFTPTKRQLHYASFYRAKGYAWLQTIPGMIASLATNGPFLLAVDWLAGWFAPRMRDGHLVLDAGQGDPVGGHAICCAGYDLDRDRLLIANSWGTGWADGGYAWLSFAAVERHGLDAWATIDLDRLPAALAVDQPEAAAAR